MPQPKFQLYKHIKISGKWRYCRAASYSNGKVKPHVVVVGAQEVFAVAHKNNFIRPDKAGHKTPVENERRFIAALKAREGYIKTLARKYGVAFCRARKIAHEVLDTVEFRRGATWPPLSSNFPQKPFDAELAQ
jgi:hypothetical protein